MTDTKNQPPTLLTCFLGCRLNQAENRKIEKQLLAAGFAPYQENNPPTVIILNTCLVTQKAEKETRQTIRRLKRDFPQSFLVVTGCAATGVKKLGLKLPAADWIIPNSQKETIATRLIKKFSPKPAKKILPAPLRAYVKIQEGCHQFCTFCLTAYVRGPEKSQPPEKVIKEIKELSSQGTKEVILTGVNLSFYGRDLSPQTNLTELLPLLLKKTSMPRLSLSSLTPNIIDKKLANIFIRDWGGEKRLSYFFHIALQSGSSRILSLMNRPKTNLKKLERTIQYIKEEIPIFNIRADIIVGFPEETEEDFEQTLHYTKSLRIAFGHIFRYSPRPGTVAFEKIKNGSWQPIPENIKKERAQKVRQLIAQIQKEEAEKLKGQKLLSLVTHQKENYSFALTNNFWRVKIKKLIPVGEIIPVKITNFYHSSLEGKA